MFDFFRSCIVVTCGNYFITIVNVPLKQQLYCNYYKDVHTCNHAMCPHFHHPLWDTFQTKF